MATWTDAGLVPDWRDEDPRADWTDPREGFDPQFEDEQRRRRDPDD